MPSHFSCAVPDSDAFLTEAMDSEVKVNEVRKAAWSGQFYPASPADLSRNIAELFARASKPDVPGEIVGLVSPHAGYEYSGQVAASTYKALQGFQYDTVIIVSPSHTKYFGGVSIYNGGAYETPLGSVATDVQTAKKLARIAPNTIYFSNMGHTGGAQAEHALEVQLPFLQIVLGSFRLVALVMGEQDQWRTLGDALAGVASEGKTLLVASSDLSHYYDATVAMKLDGAVQRAVGEFDPSGLAHIFEAGKGEACGAGPILACMHAARKLGADQSVVTAYNHSGAITGDNTGVVGYLGALFVRSGGSEEAKEYTLQLDEPTTGYLSEQDKDELRRLARQAVAAAVYNATPPQTSGAPRTLRERRGAFVTLKIHGELRGCIGHVEGHRPLVETVVQMAMAAATRDPRFLPVTPADLPEIEIEVSALTPLVRCDDPETIEVGRHGVVLVKGKHSGVLLPQVAAEHGWDRVTYLHQVCIKAGLPPEAWRDSAATLYVFEAEVF